jgi:hypothetical protein
LHQLEAGIQHVIELTRSADECHDLNATAIQKTPYNMPAQSTRSPDDENLFHCGIS